MWHFLYGRHCSKHFEFIKEVLQETYKVDIIIIPDFQISIRRHRKVNNLPKSHLVNK